ncbi:hypothetical protein HPB50_016173 [Hyalomma asiaticum]|uniref:Uncharacterized protein n=1 Tax=Hyalomma asiaticum TaxID=266040 RepID=A0ACB7TNJ5_HYAAI|nr:hypothetical protein HPB50_016173 [Hyalomma asiaticum]
MRSNRAIESGPARRAGRKNVSRPPRGSRPERQPQATRTATADVECTLDTALPRLSFHFWQKPRTTEFATHFPQSQNALAAFSFGERAYAYATIVQGVLRRKDCSSHRSQEGGAPADDKIFGLENRRSADIPKLIARSISKMAAGPVDMELKKAFQELQMKMVDTSRRLRQADVQIENLKKAVKYAYCTGEVISEAPDTRMYRAVGRMFLGSDYTEVMQILDDKINTYNEKIKSLEGNKAYLEKSLKESENNLREMIVQKQSMH